MALHHIVESLSASLAGVAIRYGAEFLAHHEAPPRVVFVPAEDDFAGGPAGPSVRARGSLASPLPRSLSTRRARVEIHIWAAGAPDDPDPHRDLKAMEALLDRVVTALHVAAAGCYRLEGGRVTASTEGVLGRVYILRAAFDVPVLFIETPATVADAVVTTFGNPEVESTLDLPAPAVDPTGSPAP